MLKEILFYIVVVVGNVIQTATGFAGTMIMMPPSIRLVGIETAKPVLAVYAVAVSLFLFIRERRHINWREFFKIIILMMVGMAVGVAAERAASFRLL
ncbi:MAG: TSUP family transporter, partial [Ruminococcaceae bacterium]|nr:TSUP family transporter [Oscillospiraceae bacterium]